MRLHELLQDLDHIELVGSPDRVVSAVHHDSRQVGPNDIFVAIQGQHNDGRRFAQNLQAAAVIADGPVMTREGVAVIHVPCARRALAQTAAFLSGHPARRLPVVGITGTNGKTTVSWMLESMAASAGIASAVLGTTGHRIAGKKRPASHTTPEAPVVQQILKEALEANCGVAIMEVSSIGLEMNRVDCIPFEVGIYTNLSQDHLDFHGTMEHYLRAKARLFEELLASEATAVINGDAPEHKSIKPECQQIWRYGSQNNHDIQVQDSTLTLQGTTARIHTPVGTAELELPLLGRHNLANAMAALGAGLALNWSLKDCLAGLKNLQTIPGRLEPIVNDCGLTVLVDYAHSPDALHTVLTTLRNIAPQDSQIWTLFGCGGDRDRSKRPKMGATVSMLSDRCVLTSDNPRSEDPLAIIEEVQTGVTIDVQIEPDRGKAIEWIIAAAEPGDIVLLAGKGHEQTQTIGTQVIEMDDRELARQALRLREQRS